VPLFEDYSALTRVNEILSNVPSKSFKGDDKQVLRAAILAEIDAINLYEQMAAVVKNKKVRETLLDVAREEKTHIGEFQALLLELDPEYERELKAGEKEVQK
jgi:rubrerythrin